MMRLLSKKGFMKTVEVFIAAMVVFSFVIVFIPRDIPVINDQSHYRLRVLEADNYFRNCVLASNSSCINQTLDYLFEEEYEYDYDVIMGFDSEVPSRAEEDHKVYTWFYSGNYTTYSPTVFRLYYWRSSFE